MEVSCFCGHTFAMLKDLMPCPSCGAIAVLPAVSFVEIAEMEADLREILEDHDP